MGYHAHDAIVVTAWDKKYILGAWEKALSLFGDQVSKITPPATNGYVSFFVPPDGSKEGWEESDDGDGKRAALIKWLRETDDYLDFVEVRFGGDFESDQPAEVTASQNLEKQPA